MEKYYSSITLRISGEDFPVDSFSEKLAVKSAKTYKKGEPWIRGTISDIQPFTAWEFNIHSNKSEIKYTHEQIEYLFQKVNPHLNTIISYQQKYKLNCETFIGVQYDEYQTLGIHFEVKHIQFFQEIKSSIDIDIYNLCIKE